MKRTLKIVVKTLLWIFSSVILLLLILVLLLQLSPIQNQIKKKAVSFIEQKIGTTVRIRDLNIVFPGKIVLQGLYLEDQHRNTLLAGERLAIDISPYKLLFNEIRINTVELQNFTANIHRSPDSVFNFDYILQAFSAKTPKDTTSKPLATAIVFGNIDLKNIRFNLNDAISRTNVKLKVTYFNTRFKKFDLQRMTFDIPVLTVHGLQTTVNQGYIETMTKTKQSEKNDPASGVPDLHLKLGEINLSTIDLSYRSETSKWQSRIILNRLKLLFDHLDLQKEDINLKSIELDGLKSKIILTQTNAHKPVTNNSKPGTKAKSTPNNWKIALNKLSITNLNFAFDDQNIKPAKNGIDFAHLNISDLNVKAKNLIYKSDISSGNIDSFSVRERSGLFIHNLRTNFLYSEKKAHLKNLFLKTDQTTLKSSISLKYPSIASLKSNPGDLALDLNIEKSTIGFKDILFIIPALSATDPFKKNPDEIIHIDGKIEGKLRNLTVRKFELSGFGNTAIVTNGTIVGLPDAATARYNILLDRLETTDKDILRGAPDSVIPDNFTLPEKIALRGYFKGTTKSFETAITALTSLGDATITAAFDATNKNQEKYNAEVNLSRFQLGKLLGNDSIGSISLQVRANGTGLDPKSTTAGAEGTIMEAGYNGYVYRNLDFKVGISAGIFNAGITMADPNLNFQIDASGSTKSPSLKLTGNIHNIDLHALNLHKSSLQISGTIRADIPSLDTDSLNGEIALTHFVITNKSQQIPLAFASIHATSTTENNTLTINTPFLEVDIGGKYQFSRLGSALSKSISQYYYSTAKTTKSKKNNPETKPQQLKFNFLLKSDPFLTCLVPKLKIQVPVTANGSYDNKTGFIDMHADIPKINYDTYDVNGANLSVTTNSDALNYTFTAKEIAARQVNLPNLKLQGSLKDNLLSYDLQLKDSNGRLRHEVGGNLTNRDNKSILSLKPELLLLDYKSWSIPADNTLTIGDDGILASGFELTHEQQSLTIQSKSSDFKAPLEVRFRNFSIESITRMVSGDTLLAGGIINGQAIVGNLKTNPTINADLTIDQLSFRNDTIGNLHIRANNPNPEQINSDITISGFGNQLNLNGSFNTKISRLDLLLNIEKLNLRSLQEFTSGNLTDSKGFLSGNLKITGNLKKPSVLGDIKFNDVGFKLTPLNTRFQGMNDNINFNSQGIRFDKFSLFDANKNELQLKGTILSADFTDFSFDLTVDATNFKALNSTAANNNTYYGDLLLNTKLKIGGTLKSPSITGAVSINKKTNLTLVLPQEDPSIVDREGVVEFIDETSLKQKETVRIKDDFTSSELRGMNLSINISIDPGVAINIIIDRINGDMLNIKGDAQLSLEINPSGNISLTGRYEFTEGAYEMSFNFIRRRFKIEKGSYLVWTGDPTAAKINITAIYETKTAPIDLVENQIGHLTGSARNIYKQRLPFQTLLIMKGELLQPEISFDIRLPEGTYNVPTEVITNSNVKLAQIRQLPSELNKQVFALLLLNRFIGENPFASESGTITTESFARQSASKILTQQLNKLASDLISGVDLEFDLESSETYYTGERENRTDLSVGISKSLFNESLTVTIGNTFQLEGSKYENQNTTTIAGDITLEYKLSRDGKYRLRAFRKNKYEVALQGQIIETGVAFIITMDYNKFRELFSGKEIGNLQ